MQLRHSLSLTGALLLGSLVAGCGPAEESQAPEQAAPVQETGTTRSAATTTGFTSHFSSWLSTNGYEPTYNLVRADLSGGSYGGKASGTDTVVNQPVIFIHGNSDKAIGTGSAGQTGWNASIDYFLSQGYKTSELYATTWGPADASLSAYQYHSKTNVMKVRKFIEAVKAYTGAAKVDIIAPLHGRDAGAQGHPRRLRHGLAGGRRVLHRPVAHILGGHLRGHRRRQPRPDVAATRRAPAPPPAAPPTACTRATSTASA